MYFSYIYIFFLCLKIKKSGVKNNLSFSLFYFTDESFLTSDLMNLGQIEFISKYVAEIDSLSKKELFGGYDIQTRFKSPVDLQVKFE